MNSYLNMHFIIAVNALVLALMIGFVAWYMHAEQNNLEYSLVSHMKETALHIEELAELTDRNGADALTERIIVDCPRRPEFEALLPRLSSASPKELISTQQLFESCGSFHAERKAIMVAQMQREYESLEQDLAYLALVRDLTPEESKLQAWRELIRLEEERSAFLFEQTELQSDILTLLINRDSAQKVSERAEQAKNVAESLTVTDAQIDALRASLIP
jgi:uncharacterized membrane-anchored protein YhcB (DUF1043 family)